MMHLVEEVDREDVVHSIEPALPIDELIEISDFGSDPGVWASFVAETQEGSVLVQSGISTPVCIVHVEESFIPQDQ